MDTQIQQTVINTMKTEHDNGNILPRNATADALAGKLKVLHEDRDELDGKIALATAGLCCLIGDNSGIDTSVGRITWKMGSAGDVDWRGVAQELGAEKHPSIVEKHRKAPVRRFTTPRAWKRRA